MEQGTIVAAQAGDRAALGDLVDEFTPTVLGAAYGLCGDWHRAADIAQEAFATMVVRLGDLREPAAFPGWLMAVVRSAARRERERVRPLAPAPAPPVGLEDLVVARDDARRLRLAVEALSPELRLPMVLHYFAGHPLEEIAELCDQPLSTVKKRMRVARARLREGMDDMAEEMLCRMRPEPGLDPSDAIRMFTAMRSGDVARVSAILDVRPDLVDVREDWSPTDSFAHRLPLTAGGGTPLLRAIERGDDAMVTLLLDRGADPNGACECNGGERPLWTAVLHRRVGTVDELLARGADPDTPAFGSSPLQVALMRGYDELVERLLAAGAQPRDAWEHRPPPIAVGTGIKALDLWCPFPERGLVRLTPGYGVGALVLLAELSLRWVRAGRGVVWTGFVQAPTDLGDVAHGLAETGIADLVHLSMAPPSASDGEQIAALDRGVAVAADGDLLVVFEETGRSSALEARLGQLSSRDGTTIVVAPLDGSVPAPSPAGSPYLASIAFDRERARRGLWPAIDPSSWSKVHDAESEALAARARAMPNAALDAFLTQPFYTAEPFMGVPGETVALDETRAAVHELLGASAQP